MIHNKTMQLIDSIFIILIILVIANMAFALYKEYYQKPSTTTTTTITCLPVELPEITGKKISSGDNIGLLHPTEIELNPELLLHVLYLHHVLSHYAAILHAVIQIILKLN